MEVNIIPGGTFVKNIKRLAKKYRSIINDLHVLEDELKINPNAGTDLGNGLRKVRMAITSKGRGKSGGARVITYYVLVSIGESTVYLLTIYDKSELSNISDKELKALIDEVL